MRVAILADAASIHTQRWVKALSRQGITIEVYSERRWANSPVPIYYLPPSRRARLQVPGAIRTLRRHLKRFQPDLVHAHYASHWGLYGALSGVRPLIVSIWGADVEVFGHQHKALNGRVLKYIFSKASAITASSQYLARVSGQFTDRPIEVIPFGIDMTRFIDSPRNKGIELRWIVNKALESVYGIDVVLKAFNLLDARGLSSWRGRILGTGSDHDQLIRQCVEAGISDRVEFLGQVDEDDLPGALGWADVGLYASRRESFGVAALELMAMGRAVVAHRVGGLAEVVDPDRTGLLVEENVPHRWAEILEPLVKDPATIRQLGANGPEWVNSRYNFKDNVEQMLALYREMAKKGDSQWTSL